MPDETHVTGIDCKKRPHPAVLTLKGSGMSRTSRNIGRIAASAITMGVGAALLAGCGSSSTSSAASPADTAKSTAGVAIAKKDIAALAKPITQWPAVPSIAHPADLHGKKIMLLPIGTSVPVINGVALADQAALAHAGADVSICDGKFDPTAVSSCLQQAATDHDYAVMSMFVDYKMAPNAFDSAVKAGVKVLVADEPAPAGVQTNANFGFFDNTKTGIGYYKIQSEAALAEEGTSANALWLRLTDSPTTTTSSDAAIARYKQLCPTCGLATIDFTTANLDKLASAVSAALVSHPNTNVVIVPVDSFVPAAQQGIQSAGFANKVKVISSSGSLDGLERVKAGTLAHDLGISVTYTAYTDANALVQLLSGDKVTPGTQAVSRDFNQSTVAGLSLTPAAYNSPQWYGNDSFEQAYYKAWGVK